MHICVSAVVPGTVVTFPVTGWLFSGQVRLGCGHTGSLLSGSAARGELKAENSTRRFA